MWNRCKASRWALMAALTCTGFAQAADMALSTAPKYLDEEVTKKPLTQLLDQAGLGKSMDSAGITVSGLIEGSYTYSMSNPPNDTITGYAFNADNQELLLNQVNLTIERKVDVSKMKFDIGGRIEQTWGEDSRFTHSNGLTIYSPSKTGLVKGSSPEVQYDINQAYIDLAFPVGNGMLVRLGKWYTPIGYEVVLPTGNALFSHSFLFDQVPYTHTGAIVAYKLNDHMDVQFGVSRGWDQFEDNNGELDYMGQLHYRHDKYDGYFNFITGSEDPATSGWRTVLDYWATYAVADQLTIGINADYGWEAQADPGTGKTAQWYGIAGYGSYKINEMFTVNGRCEWFDDQDGGAPSSLAGVPNTYYEATIGLAIKPMPTTKILSNLLIRPELRLDYADKAVFDGGTDHYQVTAAVDVIFSF